LDKTVRTGKKGWDINNRTALIGQLVQVRLDSQHDGSAQIELRGHDDHMKAGTGQLGQDNWGKNVAGEEGKDSRVRTA
jgi:hypothetical protein